jgi:GT2 family glycosyltransferase
VSISKGLPEVVDFSIAMVCWNDKAYMEPCLSSLFKSKIDYSFDVVVVDNGSKDGSQEMIQEKFPQVKIIQNSQNLGLAKACNQGIEATKGRYILLFNNDTIVNGDAFNSMVHFMEKTPEAGAVGGKLLNEDGSFQSGYGGFSSLWEEFLVALKIGEILWDGYPLHGDSEKVEQVGWMSSACLLLRREALDQVGLLDEEYFIYGDETDLQYRMKNAGWKTFYLPDATTIHFGGRSMDHWSRRKMIYRGKMLFFKKNYGVVKTTILRSLLGVVSLLKLVISVVMLLIPNRRERTQQVLKSNLDVFKLCLKLE